MNTKVDVSLLIGLHTSDVKISQPNLTYKILYILTICKTFNRNAIG